MAINKVSQVTKEAIIRKSAYGLPNRPSEQGMKAPEIKRAFFEPIIDMTYSALAETDRVVGETVAEIEAAKLEVGQNAEAALNTHKTSTEAHSDKFAEKVNVSDIVNELNSPYTNKPLSANRGRILNESIGSLAVEQNYMWGKVQKSVQSITLNSVNGVLTITYNDNTTSTIDLPLEYIIQDGYYDNETNNIVLVMENGSTIEIPAGDLVNEYFADGSLKLYSSDGKSTFGIGDALLTAINAAYDSSHTHNNSAVLSATTAAYTTEKDNLFSDAATNIEIAVQQVSDLDMSIGQPNGIASLDAKGKLSASQIPYIALSNVVDVESVEAMLALTEADVQPGDVARILDDGQLVDTYVLAGADASVLSNWKAMRVGYVAEAGHAISADTASDADRIGGKRIIHMTRAEFAFAESSGTLITDGSAYYVVTPS